MNEVINGWKIDKVRGADGFDYWISKNDNTYGRALKIDGAWCAMDKLGKLDMFHDNGVEATGKTLDELVMAVADSEASIYGNLLENRRDWNRLD